MNALTKTFRPVSFPTLLDNLFSDVDFFADNRNSISVPAVNVKENDDVFEIELAAPGLKKEDFKVNVHEKLLTISAQKEVSEAEAKENYTRKEFSFRSFSRSFRLPNTVDSEQIEATYADGVLKLHLPKKEEAKPKEPRLIEIA